MDQAETDRRIFRCVCYTLGIDPDGERAPDLDSIARMDAPFKEKREELRKELEAEFGPLHEA